jgi:hypothetical protein
MSSLAKGFGKALSEVFCHSFFGNLPQSIARRVYNVISNMIRLIRQVWRNEGAAKYNDKRQLSIQSGAGSGLCPPALIDRIVDVPASKQGAVLESRTFCIDCRNPEGSRKQAGRSIGKGDGLR